jgi:hypothetical protein
MDAHVKSLLDDGSRLWPIDWVDGRWATSAVDGATRAAYWADDGGQTVAEAFLDGFIAVSRSTVSRSTVGWDLVAATASLLGVRAAAFKSSRAVEFERVASELRR